MKAQLVQDQLFTSPASLSVPESVAIAHLKFRERFAPTRISVTRSFTRTSKSCSGPAPQPLLGSSTLHSQTREASGVDNRIVDVWIAPSGPGVWRLRRRGFCRSSASSHDWLGRGWPSPCTSG